MSSALGLVDEIIDCHAQLRGTPDNARRVDLERAIAARSARLRRYVDGAAADEVWVTAEQRSERLVYETDTINRALQHDLTLFGTVRASSGLVFNWRSTRGPAGPRFDDRALAIDWMADWLTEEGA